MLGVQCREFVIANIRLKQDDADDMARKALSRYFGREIAAHHVGERVTQHRIRGVEPCQPTRI